MRRKALRTDRQMTLIPGFDNADLYTIAAALLGSFLAAQRLFSNVGFRVAFVGAVTYAVYVLWFRFKEEFGPKYLLHFLNWCSTPDLFTLEAETQPVPLCLIMPARNPSRLAPERDEVALVLENA